MVRGFFTKDGKKRPISGMTSERPVYTPSKPSREYYESREMEVPEEDFVIDIPKYADETKTVANEIQDLTDKMKHPEVPESDIRDLNQASVAIEDAAVTLKQLSNEAGLEIPEVPLDQLSEERGGDFVSYHSRVIDILTHLETISNVRLQLYTGGTLEHDQGLRHPELTEKQRILIDYARERLIDGEKNLEGILARHRSFM
jgi:hypothetical protein